MWQAVIPDFSTSDKGRSDPCREAGGPPRLWYHHNKVLSLGEVSGTVEKSARVSERRPGLRSGQLVQDHLTDGAEMGRSSGPRILIGCIKQIPCAILMAATRQLRSTVSSIKVCRVLFFLISSHIPPFLLITEGIKILSKPRHMLSWCYAD